MRTEVEARLASARAQLLRADPAGALVTLTEALAEYPESIELRRTQAGALQQAGRKADAATVLRKLLAEHPTDAAAAFALARLLLEQTRMAEAATALRGAFADASNAADADLAIAAIELLDGSDREADAAAIADAAIAVHPGDARLHAYAGMLKLQLGDFGQARQHYMFVLEHDAHAVEWHVPIGLSSSQRYPDAAHPDFARFTGALQREDLSDAARTELHFALGKAHDDIGDFTQAARHFNQGNALAQPLARWSRKTWRRSIEARLAAQPFAQTAGSCADFKPLFIVGMPRSGTTLLAGLLARHAGVCNRGELPCIGELAQRPALNGNPARADLEAAAAYYSQQARRDDAGDTRWFIDKEPLNFRYIDLIMALFPDARIIHCQRSPRDTALSLWMQCFLDDAGRYSYDFADIAAVMRDCDRLMTHWQQRFPGSIQDVRYEELVADPGVVIESLAGWIGLSPAADDPRVRAAPATAIRTASLWQARQPVHTGSVGRWQGYAALIPALSRFATA